MNKLDELKESAKNININNTISFIKCLNERKIGKIQSDIPTINGLTIEFQKSKRCFRFSTDSIMDCKSPVKYQNSSYGFQKPFKIEYEDNLYAIENGIGAISIKIGQGFATEGELWEIETNTFKQTKGFFRAVLPLSKFAKAPLHYLLGKSMNFGSTFRAAGYINIKLNENEIGFFDFDIDKQKYVAIECRQSTDFILFERIIESLIYSYAFISGSLIRDEIFIIKYSNNEFDNIVDFQFRKIEDGITSGFELINPKEHQSYVENFSKYRANPEYFPERIFSNLNELCFNNKPILRAIRIITQARDLPNEIKIASLYVALETIKQVIIDSNIDKISPFKDKSFAATTITDLKNIISDIPEDNFNDKNMVIKKIENLNAIGNNDSFILAFKLAGYKLSKEDKKYIRLRNRFLHGNIPFDNEVEQLKNDALLEITTNTHFLVCSLLLKYVGYDGVVKDLLSYINLKKGIYSHETPLFRKI